MVEDNTAQSAQNRNPHNNTNTYLRGGTAVLVPPSSLLLVLAPLVARWCLITLCSSTPHTWSECTSRHATLWCPPSQPLRLGVRTHTWSLASCIALHTSCCGHSPVDCLQQVLCHLEPGGHFGAGWCAVLLSCVRTE